MNDAFIYMYAIVIDLIDAHEDLQILKNRKTLRLIL